MPQKTSIANHPINRKYVYLIFLAINVAMALIRLGIFPHQTFIFHASIFIIACTLFLISWELLLLINKYLEYILPLERLAVLRISVQILLTTLMLFLFALGLFDSSSKFFGEAINPVVDKVISLLNFMIALIFNLILFGSYYFHQWKVGLVSQSNLEKEQAVVKYDALRNQLNPHFLFNALTSLNSLIFENQQLASDFLQQLSKVYRYILQNKDHDTVSLKTELDFIQHYIFLLKTRFEAAIEVTFDVNKQDLDKGIVPVLSQTLIENAVKHNTISLENPLKIKFSTENNYLIVTNNMIAKRQVETSNKLGMENLKSLYTFFTEMPVIVEQNDQFFTVRIPLI